MPSCMPAYNGARFVVAGTPSGVTLAPEGGAHQSTITASVGLELPNTTLIGRRMPRARLVAVRRTRPRCRPRSNTRSARRRMGVTASGSRRAPRPGSFDDARARHRRCDDASPGPPAPIAWSTPVSATAYRRSRSPPPARVVPEALAAAAELEDGGIAAHVIGVTSRPPVCRVAAHLPRQNIRTATTPSILVPCGGFDMCAHRSSPCTTRRATRWRGSGLPRGARRVARRRLLRSVRNRE